MCKRVAWGLLFVGFASMAWLDPWSLGERDPAALADGQRMAVRHAHILVMRMGFLLLVLAKLLEYPLFSATIRQRAGWLIGTGVFLYVVGSALGLTWTPVGWLMPLGGLLNLLGFATLAQTAHHRGLEWVPKAIVSVLCLGMLLDIAMALMTIAPQTFQPAYLQPWDSVRMRMLRLAQVAVIALAALSLVYSEASSHQSQTERRGLWALTLGTIGMPLILTASGLTWLAFKNLLSIPALSVIGGVGIATWFALRRRRPLELFGWLLVISSLALGMLMGVYAFDGPLDPPTAIGGYNEFGRRLLRLGHAYAIVLGLLTLYMATERRHARGLDAPVATLLVGAVVTLSAIVLLSTGLTPSAVLAIGPVLVALSVLFRAAATPTTEPG